jgi:hypothetical protein
MQSINTILLFEVMYRHKILGEPLDEIENQLKNYPTQDAEGELARLRNDIGTDTMVREPDVEDDVSVTEAQQSGDKEAYRSHFNNMLKDFGASNISELPPDKRKDFFLKIDKHWKAKSESKKEVNEEIEWTDDIMEEFVMEFAEFGDILLLIKNEMQKDTLEEAAGKRTTMTKITRQTKIDRTLGNLAMQYAKAVDDPMYKKFKKFKDKWMKYKERIQSKYGPRVRTAARQGGGIQSILKKVGKDSASKKAKLKKATLKK